MPDGVIIELKAVDTGTDAALRKHVQAAQNAAQQETEAAQKAAKAQTAISKQAGDDAVTNARRVGQVLNEIEVQRLQLSGKRYDAELLKIKQHYGDRIEVAKTAMERERLLTSQHLAIQQAQQQQGAGFGNGPLGSLLNPAMGGSAIASIAGKASLIGGAFLAGGKIGEGLVDEALDFRKKGMMARAGTAAGGGEWGELAAIAGRQAQMDRWGKWFGVNRGTHFDYAGAAAGSMQEQAMSFGRISTIAGYNAQTAGLHGSIASAEAAQFAIGNVNAAAATAFSERQGLYGRTEARKAELEVARQAARQAFAEQKQALLDPEGKQKRILVEQYRSNSDYATAERHVTINDRDLIKAYEQDRDNHLAILKDGAKKLQAIDEESVQKRVDLAMKAQTMAIQFSGQTASSSVASMIMASTQRGAGTAAALQTFNALSQVYLMHETGQMDNAAYAAAQAQGRVALAAAGRQAWADRYAYNATIEDVGGMGQRIAAAAASVSAIAPDAATSAKMTEQGLKLLGDNLMDQKKLIENLDIPLSALLDGIVSMGEHMGAGH